MTPDAQQPQREPEYYLITPDELRYFPVYGRLELLEKIRTRPHTPQAPAIRPQKECFGKYQGVGDDRCFECNGWGYCADVSQAASTATLKTLDRIQSFIEWNQNMSSGVTEHKMWIWSEPLNKLIKSLRRTAQEHP